MNREQIKTEQQKLKERSLLIDKLSSRPGYLRKVNAALHTGTLKPRKGYWSKLLGKIKTQISTNLFSL